MSSTDAVIDIAEIPTLQESAGVDGDGDGTARRPNWAARPRSECAALLAAAGHVGGAP